MAAPAFPDKQTEFKLKSEDYTIASFNQKTSAPSTYVEDRSVSKAGYTKAGEIDTVQGTLINPIGI